MSDETDVLALFAKDEDVTMWGSDEPERAHGHVELRRLAHQVGRERGRSVERESCRSPVS